MMSVDSSFYFDHLYPLQDQVLAVIDALGTDFCLTGGTAVSRAYLHHRVSDDLDLFVNFDPRFVMWSGLIVDMLSEQSGWKTVVVMRQQYFVRILVTARDITLKVEIRQAVEGAASKATGIYPPDLARRLCTATAQDWTLVRWLDPPAVESYLQDLARLGDDLLLV